MNYLITFTPSGPYFFGNEKSLTFGGEKDDAARNSYFIRGERMPSQSTILGALRYILLQEKSHSYAAKAKNIIGDGFDIDSNQIRDKGVIESISPIFVNHGDEFFIPTPLDHNCASEEKKRSENKENNKLFFYEPFAAYLECNDVFGSKKLYVNSQNYNPKFGIAHSMMSCNDMHIEEAEIFSSIVMVGTNRKATDKGFFKREFYALKYGYTFSVFAQIDVDIDKLSYIKNPETVMLGQCHVPFSVSFKKLSPEEPNEYTELVEKIKDIIIQKHVFDNEPNRRILYCLSDTLVYNDELYNDVLFSSVAVKDYRSFAKKLYNGNVHVKKGDKLHKLVKAGSIFITDKDEVLNRLTVKTVQQQNASQIGFNSIISSKGDN